MALKPDREIIQTDITHTCDSVAERGSVVVYKTGSTGSGNALGENAGVVTLAANPSGQVPAGLLINDFVDVNESRYHLNHHKDEMNLDEPATLLRKGWVVTNKVTGTPKAGDVAYLTASGVLTPTVSATGGVVATPKVGQFDGGKDENGYAKVSIALPVV